MNLEGWSFWWGLPYCITSQDQVGSTACPEDTQHLLVEKRRNPSRPVDSRPAQKQVESDGGWKEADVRFFFSGQSSTNTCSNWNILRWPIWSSNFRKKNIARTMWDDSWWMEKKQQGRLVSLFPPELISFSRRIPQLEAPIIFSVVHPMEGGYCPKSFLTSLIIWTHPNPLATKIQPGRSLKRAWLARLSR